MTTLQIIGVGSLGEALARGFIESRHVKPNDLHLIHRNPTRAQNIASDFPGAHLSTDVQADMDAIVTVLPEDTDLILGELRKAGVKRVASVITGVTIERLQEGLNTKTGVFRVMSNIAVKYRLGQLAISCPEETSAIDLDWARQLFEQVGDVVVIDDSMIDAFTTIYGCASGFMMKFVSALTDAAVDLGFERQDAQRLLISSLRGNAKWLSENVDNMHEELHWMTRLGGPTFALAKSLDDNHFDEVIHKAAIAATERSQEMSHGG